MYLSIDEGLFVLPAQNMLNLSVLDEWVGNFGGCKHGSKVRSVEQCVCIAKFLYFRLDLGIAEISRLTNPVAIRRITEGHINRERLDKDCDRWMSTLGDLYSDIYAQWFDSLNPEVLIDMLRNYETLIIVDQRTTSSANELQRMPCFNGLGEASHKATGLVEFATRETCRTLRGSERAELGERVDGALQYQWVQRGKRPLLDQQVKAIYDENSFMGNVLFLCFTFAFDRTYPRT